MQENSSFDLLFTAHGLAECLIDVLDTAHRTAISESEDIVIQRLSECGQLRAELLGLVAQLRLYGDRQQPLQFNC